MATGSFEKVDFPLEDQSAFAKRLCRASPANVVCLWPWGGPELLLRCCLITTQAGYWQRPPRGGTGRRDLPSHGTLMLPPLQACTMLMVTTVGSV